MNETNEMWRAVRDEVRKEKDDREDYRWRRYFMMLAKHPEIIELRKLGEYGVRLMHFEWPQSRYVDYWPRTSSISYEGRTLKGWIKLLKILGVKRAP